jgi:hypothetical protein
VWTRHWHEYLLAVLALATAPIPVAGGEARLPEPFAEKIAETLVSGDSAAARRFLTEEQQSLGHRLLAIAKDENMPHSRRCCAIFLLGE